MFTHGSRAKLYIWGPGTAGAERDMSQFISETGLSSESDQAEVSALGDTHKQYVVGLADGGFELSGHLDIQAQGWLEEWRLNSQAGTAVKFKYFPQGSVAGRGYYEGTAVAASHNYSTPVDDKASFASEWKVQDWPLFGTVS